MPDLGCIGTAYGATEEDIRVDAHPHIGTNKLPKIIASNASSHSGNQVEQVVFESTSNRYSRHKKTPCRKRSCNHKDGDTNRGFNQMILATGHSARDIFELLHKKEVAIEAKAFAVGVRVEHTQELIDQIQYKCKTRGEFLPPAPYSIVKQIKGRGVYSFCMCPGGIIAPCATKPGEVVTNGWSPSKRDYPTSNSGIVMELKLEDFVKYEKIWTFSRYAIPKRDRTKCMEIRG